MYKDLQLNEKVLMCFHFGHSLIQFDQILEFLKLMTIHIDNYDLSTNKIKQINYENINVITYANNNLYIKKYFLTITYLYHQLEQYKQKV